jgi:Tol biopolymer transport system component
MPQQNVCLALRGSYNDEPWQLYLIDEGSAHLRQLTFDLKVIRFSWSPDGGHIAFLSSGYTPPDMHVGSYFTFTLYCLDADGSHLRHLTEKRGKIDFSWSPDSRQLAFTCSEELHRPGNHQGELSILDLESGEVRQIIKEPAYPIWSPETAQIAFLWKYDRHLLSDNEK